MQKSDAKKFAIWMSVLAEVYNRTITETLSEAYWHALDRFEYAQIDKAFKDYIGNPGIGKRMPTPADIIFLIEGTNEQKALEAWTKVEKATRNIGCYNSVAFDDRRIHAVIEDMGGWVKLCNSRIIDMSFRAQEFQKRYLRYLVAKPKNIPSSLIGIEENNCRQFGLPAPEVKQIGEPSSTLMLEDKSTINSELSISLSNLELQPITSRYK